jgi:hypothetical protein
VKYQFKSYGSGGKIPTSRRIPIIASFGLITITLLISCHKKGEISANAFRLPFPDAKMSAFYQARVDSSEFLWFTDVKATASAFMNEEVPGSNISTGEVVIISEGLFHAQAEVQLPDKKLLLTMKRLFEEKGDNSIWQVVKVEEKIWPKDKSKSATSQ